MRKKFIALLVSFILTFSVSGLSYVRAQSSQEDIQGNLVIVGGGLGSSNKVVYEKFIELAGSKKAKIGIIPAASGKLKSSIDFRQDLINYGVSPESVEILPLSNHDFSDTDENESNWKDHANSSEIAKEIRGLTAIWFVGGDQQRIVDTLRSEGKDSIVLQEIWGIYRNGAVIGGTSAGAAIMSNTMITGGDSLGALKGYYEKNHNQGEGKEYEPLSVEKGLGFFQNGLVDQHMDERARFARLAITAIQYENNGNLAYGIDEDTAMVVSNKEKTIEVIGRSGVSVIDVNEAKRNGNLENIKINYLAQGDKIHFDTNTIDFSKNKYETKGYEYYSFKALPNTGLLTPYGKLKDYLAYSLVDNESSQEVKSYLYDKEGRGYEIVFRKSKDTNGYWNYTDGQKDDYSIQNVTMDIHPRKLVFSEQDSEIDIDYKKSDFKVSNQASEEPIKGNLVIVGGALGSSNSAVYNKLIELAGGPENAKVGIIPAASTKLTSSNDFTKDLIKYGVKKDSIEILPISNHDFKGTPVDEKQWINNMNDDQLVKKISKLNCIWFVGGDQTLITSSLLNENGSNSKVLDAIWKIYKNGAVIGGTSAGAAIMSNTMIAGGDSYCALRYGFTKFYDDMEQQEGGPVYLEKGLNFFQDGIVDQHFDKKARLGRLIVTANEKGKKNQLAYGVDEDTAMVVNNKKHQVDVVGRGGLTVIDLSKVKTSKNMPNKYKNVIVSVISPGDHVNLLTNEVSVSNLKSSTKGFEYYDSKVAPYTGVFSPHGLLKNFLAYNLVDNAQTKEVHSYSFNDDKGFELSFRKTAETNGYWTYKDGQKDDYSVVNVSLDIKPINVVIR
ncbi:cyanophycinase [Gottfriedia acidiceleris]|uniref:cyanophycinase n=1 Tax=Bacillaceae TaxID=186817 RepID=UPI000BEB5121|nr:cyanophycinase [Bacillus sp. AFS096315]PEC47764.1 cyanophycinase [Bacillus sp. AFS096315]